MRRPIPGFVLRLLARRLSPRLFDDVAGDLEERWRRDAETSPVRAWMDLCRIAASVLWHNWLEDRSRARGTTRGDAMFASALQDLRFGARTLLKSPTFTLVAVVTLAAGIGMNTAIFSVANAVLFRPLAFADPERLVTLREKNPRFWEGPVPVTPATYLYLRDNSRSFEQLAAMAPRSFNAAGFGEPERLSGAAATASLFTALRVVPEVGRGFLPEEEQPGRDRVAILDHGLWQRRFGGDAGVIGTSIVLDDSSYTIVGVMPRELRLPTGQPAIWLPLPFTAKDTENRGTHLLRVIGRIGPGVTARQAQTEVDTLMRQLAQKYPKTHESRSASIDPLREEGVTSARPALLVLLGAVAFLLLIACANVASLLLVRTVSRRRELAARIALGASAWRVLRHLLTETLILTACGGAVGLALAVWTVRFFVLIGPADIPHLADTHVDWRVLSYTLGLVFLAAAAASVAPIVHSLRINVNESLLAGGAGRTTRTAHLGSILVAEISLASILLVGAGLTARSYDALLRVDPGVRIEDVTALSVSLPRNRYADAHQRAAFFESVLERMKMLPGVESAAFVQNLPLWGGGGAFFFVEVEGQPPLPSGEYSRAEHHAVSEDYFRLMGIPLLEGRSFTNRDTANEAAVIVINDSMAKRYFPNGSAVGRKIRILGNDEPTREIVGIVGDVRHRGLDADVIHEMYVPYRQAALLTGVFISRTSSDTSAIVPALKAQVWAVDPRLPIPRIVTMERLLEQSVSRRRFSMLLMSLFAGVALLLAAVGIYGVISYSVSQSTREIGIRMALGAQHGNLAKLIAAQGLRVTLSGLALGVAGAFALTRFMEGMLFRVTAGDPWTFAAVSALLVVVASIACYFPARRAMRVDPLVALRHE